jgi:hypothetical protein
LTLTNQWVHSAFSREKKWHNGASYESDKENIAHRIPKYFRM